MSELERQAIQIVKDQIANGETVTNFDKAVQSMIVWLRQNEERLIRRAN